MTNATLAGAVVRWQREHGRRELPWQNTRDPYRVWLSEVMLQQTQVATVLGYYERFLQRFPDVAALASAPLDDVLALWSGLGYYSRARNLHACAKAVVELHGGSFPQTAAALETLPGIGRSTAAAIAAFCFDERVAILDGNVKRVLSRVLAFDGDLAVQRHERELWEQASRLLPSEPRDMVAYTQGLMDLGATVCAVRDPRCLLCPLNPHCRASREGTQSRFPVKIRRIKRSARENWWLWLQWGERLWLHQRPAKGVWAGLWTLPLFDSEDDLIETLPAHARSQALPTVRHALTHFDWTLHVRRARLARNPSRALMQALAELIPQAEGGWYTQDEALALALPAPLRSLLSR